MQRSAKWDNAKAVLIFLMVLAHYLGDGIVYRDLHGGLWDIGTGLYCAIYLFHMPMFAFISGYFSKNTGKARNTAFSELLLPYLVFNLLFLLLARKAANVVFFPYGPLWYLLALFFWRMAAKDVVKVQYCWLWAMVFALLSSLFGPGNNYDAFSRAVGFFPFFLLGLRTEPETVKKVDKIPRWLCVLVLLGAFGGAVFLVRRGVSFQNICFFFGLYQPSRTSLKYVLAELLHYPVALILSVCLFRLIPEKPLAITHIGRNTMTVLLFHSIPQLREAMNMIFPFMDSAAANLVYRTALALVMTGLLGSDMVADGYRRLMACIRRKLPRRRTTAVSP